MDNLEKKGWQENTETADHLFTGYALSRFVVEMGDGDGSFQAIGANVGGAWEERMGGGSSQEVHKALTYLAANWWVL